MAPRKGWLEVTVAPGRVRLRRAGDEWALECRKPRALVVLSQEQVEALHLTLDAEQLAAAVKPMQ